MDKKSRELLRTKYDDLVEKHGVNISALHENGCRYEREHQRIKFQHVLKHLDFDESLLDIGCGLGDLAQFCRGEGWKGKYTGIDISSGMVQNTRSRLNTKNIFQLDVLEEPYDGRHDVVASISTLQQKPLYMDGIDYLEKMISKMLAICAKCVIFDVFSTKFADHENPDNIYINPSIFLERLYTFSNNLILYNNYNPYQLMVVLYKEKLTGWKV